MYVADCISSSQVDKCLADNMTFWNMSCYSSLEFCHHFGYHGLNVSHCYNHNNTTNVTFSVGMVEFTNRVSAAEDYFR